MSVELSRNPHNKGSTLVIGLAEDSDAGQYVCQLGSNEQKEIKHTVLVRGKTSSSTGCFKLLGFFEKPIPQPLVDTFSKLVTYLFPYDSKFSY